MSLKNHILVILNSWVPTYTLDSSFLLNSSITSPKTRPVDLPTPMFIGLPLLCSSVSVTPVIISCTIYKINMSNHFLRSFVQGIVNRFESFFSTSELYSYPYNKHPSKTLTLISSVEGPLYTLIRLFSPLFRDFLSKTFPSTCRKLPQLLSTIFPVFSKCLITQMSIGFLFIQLLLMLVQTPKLLFSWFYFLNDLLIESYNEY